MVIVPGKHGCVCRWAATLSLKHVIFKNCLSSFFLNIPFLSFLSFPLLLLLIPLPVFLFLSVLFFSNNNVLCLELFPCLSTSISLLFCFHSQSTILSLALQIWLLYLHKNVKLLIGCFPTQAFHKYAPNTHDRILYSRSPITKIFVHTWSLSPLAFPLWNIIRIIW